jgi:hypothetical protein
MRVLNATKNIELANAACMASSFFARTLGLMGRRSLPQSGALVLKPCNSIHTCFMRFPIDVVFVSAEGRVVGLERDIRPWRLTRIYWKAAYCVEFMSESLPAGSISLGDIISLK